MLRPLRLSKKKKLWYSGGFALSDLSNGIVNLQTYDASQYTLDGSNNVSNWIDLFNSNGFVQATSIDRPDGATIATDGILFDGGNEFLESNANLANFTSFSAFTYFSVIKRTTATQGMNGLNFADSAVADKIISIDAILASDNATVAARNDLATIWRDPGDFDIPYGNVETVNNVYALATITSNGSRWRLRLNGVDLGLAFILGGNSGKYADDIASLDTVSLGARLQSTAQFFEGGLKSVTMYSGEKPDNEIELAENFINNKYSIF